MLPNESVPGIPETPPLELIALQPGDRREVSEADAAIGQNRAAMLDFYGAHRDELHGLLSSGDIEGARQLAQPIAQGYLREQALTAASALQRGRVGIADIHKRTGTYDPLQVIAAGGTGEDAAELAGLEMDVALRSMEDNGASPHSTPPDGVVGGPIRPDFHDDDED